MHDTDFSTPSYLEFKKSRSVRKRLWSTCTGLDFEIVNCFVPMQLIKNLSAYRNKIAGDSPEICRGLDSHGFEDLLRSIIFYTSITCDYDKMTLKNLRLVHQMKFGQQCLVAG